MISRLGCAHWGVRDFREVGKWVGGGNRASSPPARGPHAHRAGPGTSTCLTDAAAGADWLCGLGFILATLCLQVAFILGWTYQGWGSASISRLIETAAAFPLPWRVTPRGIKAHWKGPEKEIGCLGSAASQLCDPGRISFYL